MNYKGLCKNEVDTALQNAVPQKPIVYELGGDYYYKCHWVKCNETVTKWYNYCPKCGQKIDWED